MRNLIVAALLCATTMLAQPLLAQDAERPSYGAISAATAAVTDAYFAAYIGRDWDMLETLIAEDASFDDPTATMVFGGLKSEGAATMMERFRTGYASLTHMEFDTSRRFVSSNVAVYEGNLSWGLDMGEGLVVESVTPMVIILTVADGKVVEHRDYVDYEPFVEALKAARAK